MRIGSCAYITLYTEYDIHIYTNENIFCSIVHLYRVRARARAILVP